ncbi:hypothetical protein [Corynebacterium efficiens YS-314]|uniref:Major facilitator superfamily (MFS) profile domain-containing protein n=1 Tax=Corynebacterium efficiens (strain DSM 44549 / YS-314 / AJ 12310 / JCM 11189 / NBRC 100395) TaxID=196164 RepID=Q8FUC3_COREF|nr:hypothetical protein [Corynebacterium efficiens YS-314]
MILLLLSAGWAANHFASMIMVLREQLGISSMLLNSAFGIYALGLLPGLLGGGVLADRFGARPVVLTGAVGAAAGNLSLLFSHDGAGLLVGRFIVGLGVGLAVSAGTAWAGRLRGASGVTSAGIALTSGFALGPIASGLLAVALPTDLVVAVPFAVTCLFSLVAVVHAALVGDVRAPVPAPTPRLSTNPPAPHSTSRDTSRTDSRSMSKALAVSLPMAIWVFSTVTTSLVILTARTSSNFDNGVLLPGMASVLSFSVGLGVQALGRRFGWGRVSGIVGALLAATGFALVAYGGEGAPVWVFVLAAPILGAAYGLSLREGLLGIEAYTPPARRGTAIGIYYVFTYLGFGLPVLLDALMPVWGAVLPLLVISALAVGSAVVRALQIRRGYLPAR